MAPGDWDLYLAPSRGRGGATPAPKVAKEMVAAEGQRLTLGDTTITFHLTPGHTPGCLSMEYTVFDGGKPFKAVTLGGSGMPGLEQLDQFMRSHERMKAIPDVQVMLSDHPYMADFYNLQKQRKRGSPGPTRSSSPVEGVADDAVRAGEKNRNTIARSPSRCNEQRTLVVEDDPTPSQVLRDNLLCMSLTSIVRMTAIS
jgi:hypothetical protein